MKVYAEFHKEGYNQYRRITLLQFGESWDLLGSAVLKNPGSAQPMDKVSIEDLKLINSFLPTSQVNPENWYRFRADSTMGFLEKIFNGYYLGKEKNLDGVIQLFNLTYLKEPNLDLAHEKANESKSHLLFPNVNELIMSFKKKPVYLGWFDTWKKINGAEPIAKGIFDALKNRSGNYLNADFKENRFYHPMYINMHFKNPQIISILREFQKLL
ncbi:hypothetical protein E4S40_10755 [Algoriphagus kandeliae]|uniref:Uncharacterized protein n=1 Tax=Algoriphagus kandeliae TaxID=2562278 RepID=A0A4Y9QTI5_9BACT|nr:hypothetical protein [Algoriphagus kandeliae]TFV94493.1 hypothetical protein E4S40_10755 [Algoriphagus kandeliae]